MNPMTVFGRTCILGAALFFCSAGSSRAIAIWPSMPGSWIGFARSTTDKDPGPIQDVLLEVVRQDRARFSGQITLSAVQRTGDESGPVPFFCDGSVSQANVLHVVGRSTDGALILVMHGKTRAFGDGSVRVAALQYQVHDLIGTLLNQGDILLLQRTGGLLWADMRVPAVQGNWVGDWESRGPDLLQGQARILVDQQIGSGFQGALGIDPPPSPPGGPVAIPYPLAMNIHGTLSLPAVQDGTSNTLIIGEDSTHGIIAVLIGLLLPAVQDADGNLRPAQMEGRYMLFDSLESLYDGVWLGTDTSLDHGSYSLPAVQIIP